MSIGVLLTINLRGAISGPVRHVDKQTMTVDVSPVGSKHVELMTKKIVHNDRPTLKCCKKLNLQQHVLDLWAVSECPRWAKPSFWKTLTSQQKIEAHLHSFDEGYGVSYEFV